MFQSIQIDGKKYKIDQSKVKGVGGEATVVEVNGKAVKIYHAPNNIRTQKLLDITSHDFNLPDNVCVPESVVYDPTGGLVIGFSMRLLTTRFEPVERLSSRSFRKSNSQINTSSIVDLFLNKHKTTRDIHSAGFVVGDYNDMNVLFNGTSPVFIDVDSFQFGSHICSVATEQFIDPSLYNIDLAKKPYFQPKNDWYSWFCMFIRSVLLVHPYRGTHPTLQTLPQRALAGVTFLDKNVIYPKTGNPPELLSSDVMKVFEDVFTKGKRFEVFPVEVLSEYKKCLVKCSSCGCQYPAERKHCINCAHITTQDVHRKVNIVSKPGKRTVVADSLISTTGEIVWHGVRNNDVYAVAIESGKYVYLYKEPHKAVIKKGICPVSSFGRFDMFGAKYLVVNKQPGLVEIFDTSSDFSIPVVSQSVDTYKGDATFACTKDNLFYIQNASLMKFEFNLKFNRFISSSIGYVMKDQTWICGSPNNSYVFGFQRIFNMMNFFLYSFDGKQNHWNINIGQLDSNESLLDWSVYFSGDYCLLLLKTEITGKTHTRFYLIKHDAVIFTFRTASKASDLYFRIHGKAFVAKNDAAMLLHPTDDGIVQEMCKADGSNQSLLSETEQFLTDSDSLIQFNKGILVAGDREINYLEIQ